MSLITAARRTLQGFSRTWRLTAAAVGCGLLGSLTIVQAQPVTMLHSFTAPDALGPTSLLLGRDGNFYGTTIGGGRSDDGTVFQMTPTGAVTILHAFTGSPGDGNRPEGGLLQGRDGNFYGTTYSGGVPSSAYGQTDGYGTVFRMTRAGAVTILHAFTGSPGDGANPSAGLLLGHDGNFYGTTFQGGVSSALCPLGCGTVFQMTPTGALTVLYAFTDTNGDGGGPVGLLQGGDGNFYGTTFYGGVPGCIEGCGTIFKMTPTGMVTILYAFTGSNGDGAHPVAGLLQGSDGNFYGTTREGGAPYGTVFKMTLTGAVTILHAFTGSDGDGAAPWARLLQGRDGNFYGTTFYGGLSTPIGSGIGYGTIFRVTPSGALTVLHTFTGSPGDGAYPQASLVHGREGTFYGTTMSGGTTGNGTVFELEWLTSVPASAEVGTTDPPLAAPAHGDGIRLVYDRGEGGVADPRGWGDFSARQKPN